MKNLLPLFTALTVAFWIGATAILSVQNATPVALKFLVFQSVELPVGVVLALGASAGAIGAAALPALGMSSLAETRSGREEAEEGRD
ncbi:MAG: DUF1049 domain-containing protein [Actinomycetota bacterium]